MPRTGTDPILEGCVDVDDACSTMAIERLQRLVSPHFGDAVGDALPAGELIDLLSTEVEDVVTPGGTKTCGAVTRSAMSSTDVAVAAALAEAAINGTLHLLSRV